jgi:hypothetical protein
MRTLFRLALLGLGFGVLVLGIALYVLVAKTSAIVSHVASRVLPQLSREVGYDLRIGGLQGHVFPLPRVEVSDFTVATTAGEPPLLVAKQVRAYVMLWPLVKSFGREVHFSSVAVEGAVASIATRRDGSSNLGRLVSFWGTLARDKPAWQLDSATVRSARLAVFDLRENNQPRILVDAFEVDCSPCAAKTTLEARGQMAAARPNVSVRAAVHGSVLHATFTATEVDLAELKHALPGYSAELVSGGQLSTEGEVATDSRGSWVITGRGKVDRLLTGKEVIQVGFELRTSLDLGPSAPTPIELSPVAADRFVIGRIEIRDLRTRATLGRDAVRISELTGKLAGGSIAVSEGRLDLGTRNLPWAMRGTTDKLDLSELGQAVEVKLPITGKSSASFDLSGAGVKWDTLRPTLAGAGRFKVEEATVRAETSAILTRSIRGALNTFAMGGLFPELGPMTIAPLSAPFRVGQGVVRLEDAVAFRAHIGEAILKGTIGLDQKLALTGSATLRWTPVAGMKAHAATVPIAIRGTLSSPSLEVTATPAQLLGAIAGAAPSISEIEAEAKRRLKSWLEGK